MLADTHIFRRIKCFTIKLIFMAGDIKDWVVEHYLKALAGLATYLLYSVAADIKEIKITLVEVAKAQAVLEQRVTRNESKLEKHDDKFEELDKERTTFYQTYKLERK